MYIRFVCDRPHPRVDAEAGLFDAYWSWEETAHREFLSGQYRCRKSNPAFRQWRRRYLAAVSAAKRFRGLDCPDLTGPHRVCRGREALFWFREAAAFPGHRKGSLVLRARDLAYAMTRVGIEIREIAVTQPGEVLWQDPFQVLALPAGPVPRAFGSGAEQPAMLGRGPAHVKLSP